MIVGISGLIRMCKWLIPKIKMHIRQSAWMNKLMSRPLMKRYLTDGLFRAEVSLYTSLFLNLSYVVIKLFSGLYYRSIWLVTLGAYYFMLTLMRLPLALYLHKNQLGVDYSAEMPLYRLCGILMMPVNIVFSGICVLVVKENQSFSYPGVLIYVMAGYTFYYVVSAIISVMKYRRYGSPVLSASKVIRLTTALVSVLSLETAMIGRFGSEDTSFRQMMTGISGGLVCAILFGMGTYMIIKSFSAKRNKK